MKTKRTFCACLLIIPLILAVLVAPAGSQQPSDEGATAQPADSPSAGAETWAIAGGIALVVLGPAFKNANRPAVP